VAQRVRRNPFKTGAVAGGRESLFDVVGTRTGLRESLGRKILSLSNV
jgi:hypothetical protein